jgi:hypothetical protein
MHEVRAGDAFRGIPSQSSSPRRAEFVVCPLSCGGNRAYRQRRREAEKQAAHAEWLAGREEHRRQEREQRARWERAAGVRGT